MIINLRELKEKDAPLMLEWMHDENIQKFFQKNMMTTTLEDAKTFCNSSKIPLSPVEGQSIHFAIVNENDEYLGTISLKDISLANKTAEYAISTRKSVHGKGVAKEATRLILEKAFREYDLHKVYLNVLEYNKAAIGLYEKCGFIYEGKAREQVYINGKYETLKWYGILEHEFNSELFQKK